MKNYILIMLLGLATLAQAQTEKGKFLVAGGAGLQFSSSSQRFVYDGVTDLQQTVNSFSLLPSVGFFVVDNFALGLNGTISSTTVVDEDGDKTRSNQHLIVPTALYFIPLAGQVRPFVQAGAGFSTQVQKYIPKDGDNLSLSYISLVLNFGGGIAIFLNDWVSANIGLSYTNVNQKNKDDTNEVLRQGNFAGNLGFSLFLGK